MNTHVKSSILLALFFALCSFGSAAAAPVPQTFTLQAGWNAIFLEIEPDDPDPAVVFSAISAQLVSVWKWNSNSSTVEFIQNSDEMVPTHPNYLTYLPADPLLTNLHAIHGNSAYLIQTNGPASLTVTGEPLPPKIAWKANAFNFVGFHLDETSLSLFFDFFSSSPAHAVKENGDPEIYMLNNTSASWIEVTSADQMSKGEGFWIYCKGSSEFNGPIAIQLERGDGLHYGSILSVQDVIFKNDSLAEKTINLSLSSDEVPLYFWNFDPTQEIAEWVKIPPPPAFLTITSGESQLLRVGVKRADPVPLAAGQEFISNLKITDDAGTFIQIPVSVVGVDYTGLWVGQAKINKVSRLARNDEPDPLVTPTGSEFNFRIILHVDEANEVRLLKQVLQMWDDNQDPVSAVLFTDESLIPNYSGISLRDGRPVGRRISAPAFGTFYTNGIKVNEKVMNRSGVFGEDNATLEVSLVLPADDPTNPFVHKYHLDHLLPKPGDSAEEKFEITRTITLKFSDTDSDDNNIVGTDNLGWGSSDMGGIYRETITGLYSNMTDQGLRESIETEGIFLLHKISDVGTVTSPPPP